MTGPWVAAFSVMCGVLIVVILLLTGLFRRVNGVLEQVESAVAALRLSSDIEGLPPGARVPDTMLKMTGGTTLLSSSWFAEGSAIVLFLSPDCEPCESLHAELDEAGWNSSAIRLLLAREDENTAVRGATLLSPNSSIEFAVSFGTRAYPMAYLTDSNGVVVARAIPSSVDSLMALAESGGASNHEPSRSTAHGNHHHESTIAT